MEKDRLDGSARANLRCRIGVCPFDRGYADKSQKSTGVWIINNSEWLASFNPRHLENYNHYLFEFYDEIVEVIIKEPIFGKETFDIVDVIDQEPRLNDAYIRKAESMEEQGLEEEAIKHYQLYIDNPSPDSGPKDLQYAQRCINFLKTGDVNKKG